MSSEHEKHYICANYCWHFWNQIFPHSVAATAPQQGLLTKCIDHTLHGVGRTIRTANGTRVEPRGRRKSEEMTRCSLRKNWQAVPERMVSSLQVARTHSHVINISGSAMYWIFPVKDTHHYSSASLMDGHTPKQNYH